MIKLTGIKLSNFLSHKVTKLDFRDGQKILIDGKSGAGKSSIIEALVWGLYEKGRSDNRSMIRHGEKKMEVIIDLQDDATKYKVIRTVTDKGKHSLEVYTAAIGDTEKFTPAEVLGIKGAQEFIEKKILRSSYLLFVNSIAYLQDGSDSFVKQTAVKRKDILLEIANAAAYDELYVKTKDAIKEREGKINLELSTISYLEKDIARYQDTIRTRTDVMLSRNQHLDKANEIKKAIDAIRAEKEANASLIKEIELAYAAYDTASKRHTEVSTEYQSKNAKLLGIYIPDVEALKKDLSQEEFIKGEKEIEDWKYKACSEWDRKMLEITRERPVDYRLDAQIKQANADIIKILKEEIELCPELNKVCPLLDKKRQERVDYLNTAMEELSRQKVEYEKAILVYDQKEVDLGLRPSVDNEKLLRLSNELKRLEVVQKALYKAESDKTIYDTLSEEVRLLSFKQHDAEAEKEVAMDRYNMAKVKSRPGHEFDLKIREQEDQLKSVEASISDLNSKLMTIASFEEKISDINREIDAKSSAMSNIQKEISDLTLLKGAFGSNGVKSIMIDFIIPRLEDSINRILHQLSDFTVKLDTQKKGVGEDVTIEGLFITIFNEHGEEFDFANYSGGERLKITVAISEALAEIQNIGFRILDETFIGLDSESTESFASVLSELQARFSQLLCISHLQQIKDLFQEKMIVVKRQGVSLVSTI